MTTAAVALVVGTAAIGVDGQSPSALAGAWEGQMLLNNNWRFMEAHFGGAPSDARVDLPQERREFSGFSLDGTRLRWTLTRGQARIAFTGTWSDDVIRGEAEQNGVLGEFQLVRTHTAPRETSRYVGTYLTGAGDLISVARFGFGDDKDRLAVLDARRGYWGTLLPTGPLSFTFAPARSGRFPVSLRVEFGDSRATGEVSLVGPGPERLSARRVDLYETTDVTIPNGDVTLAGTVVKPRGERTGGHPAIVMVHSSGNQSRNGPNAYFRLIANILASRGIAVLVYDKRGVGDSTGSWTSASFADLASDAHAAVAALRSTAGVDPRRVGLWSLSQGGWIAPLVAARSRDAAFLTLVSAAATSPAQQEIDRVAALMRGAGASAADLADASEYLRVFFDVVSGAKPWDDLAAAMARTANATWLSYVPRPRTAQQAGWAPAPATLNPADIFRNVQIPVLTIHGEVDLDVPAVANASLFARLATHSGSRRQIYTNADHYILTGVQDPDRQYRRLSGGYLDLLVDWINARR